MKLGSMVGGLFTRGGAGSSATGRDVLIKGIMDVQKKSAAFLSKENVRHLIGNVGDFFRPGTPVGGTTLEKIIKSSQSQSLVPLRGGSLVPARGTSVARTEPAPSRFSYDYVLRRAGLTLAALGGVSYFAGGGRQPPTQPPIQTPGQSFVPPPVPPAGASAAAGAFGEDSSFRKRASGFFDFLKSEAGKFYGYLNEEQQKYMAGVNALMKEAEQFQPDREIFGPEGAKLVDALTKQINAGAYDHGNEAATSFNEGFITTINSGLSGSISALFRGETSSVKKIFSNFIFSLTDLWAQFLADMTTQSLSSAITDRKGSHGILGYLLPQVFESSDLNQLLSQIQHARFLDEYNVYPKGSSLLDDNFGGIFGAGAGWLSNKKRDLGLSDFFDLSSREDVGVKYSGARSSHKPGFFRDVFGGIFDAGAGAFRDYKFSPTRAPVEFSAGGLYNRPDIRPDIWDPNKYGSRFYANKYGSRFYTGMASGGVLVGERGPEFLLNAKATRNYGGLLKRMNDGDLEKKGMGGDKNLNITNHIAAGVTQEQLGAALVEVKSQIRREMFREARTPDSPMRRTFGLAR